MQAVGGLRHIRRAVRAARKHANVATAAAAVSVDEVEKHSIGSAVKPLSSEPLKRLRDLALKDGRRDAVEALLDQLDQRITSALPLDSLDPRSRGCSVAEVGGIEAAQSVALITSTLLAAHESQLPELRDFRLSESHIYTLHEVVGDSLTDSIEMTLLTPSQLRTLLLQAKSQGDAAGLLTKALQAQLPPKLAVEALAVALEDTDTDRNVDTGDEDDDEKEKDDTVRGLSEWHVRAALQCATTTACSSPDMLQRLLRHLPHATATMVADILCRNAALLSDVSDEVHEALLRWSQSSYASLEGVDAMWTRVFQEFSVDATNLESAHFLLKLCLQGHSVVSTMRSPETLVSSPMTLGHVSLLSSFRPFLLRVLQAGTLDDATSLLPILLGADSSALLLAEASAQVGARRVRKELRYALRNPDHGGVFKDLDITLNTKEQAALQLANEFNDPDLDSNDDAWYHMVTEVAQSRYVSEERDGEEDEDYSRYDEDYSADFDSDDEEDFDNFDDTQHRLTEEELDEAEDDEDYLDHLRKLREKIPHLIPPLGVAHDLDHEMKEDLDVDPAGLNMGLRLEDDQERFMLRDHRLALVVADKAAGGRWSRVLLRLERRALEQFIGTEQESEEDEAKLAKYFFDETTVLSTVLPASRSELYLRLPARLQRLRHLWSEAPEGPSTGGSPLHRLSKCPESLSLLLSLVSLALEAQHMHDESVELLCEVMCDTALIEALGPRQEASSRNAPWTDNTESNATRFETPALVLAWKQLLEVLRRHPHDGLCDALRDAIKGRRVPPFLLRQLRSIPALAVDAKDGNSDDATSADTLLSVDTVGAAVAQHVAAVDAAEENWRQLAVNLLQQLGQPVNDEALRRVRPVDVYEALELEQSDVLEDTYRMVESRRRCELPSSVWRQAATVVRRSSDDNFVRSAAPLVASLANAPHSEMSDQALEHWKQVVKEASDVPSRPAFLQMTELVDVLTQTAVHAPFWTTVLCRSAMTQLSSSRRSFLRQRLAHRLGASSSNVRNFVRRCAVLREPFHEGEPHSWLVELARSTPILPGEDVTLLAHVLLPEIMSLSDKVDEVQMLHSVCYLLLQWHGLDAVEQLLTFVDSQRHWRHRGDTLHSLRTLCARHLNEQCNLRVSLPDDEAIEWTTHSLLPFLIRSEVWNIMSGLPELTSNISAQVQRAKNTAGNAQTLLDRVQTAQQEYTEQQDAVEALFSAADPE